MAILLFQVRSTCSNGMREELHYRTILDQRNRRREVLEKSLRDHE